MKNLFLISLITLLSLPAFAQKPSKLRVKKLRSTLSISAELGAGLKRVGLKATETEEEDCTPPPCTGIVDPWTCECTPDTRDPWEDEAIASRMKAIQQFEGAIKRGEGGKLLPKSILLEAQKRYPGASLKALVSRMNFYSSSLK